MTKNKDLGEDGKKENNIKYLVWFLANALWFGFFFVAILKYNWRPWCLAVPIIFNWKLDKESIS